MNLEAYHLALSGVTRYGLSLAAQAALKGEHGSTFFPNPAEFKRLYEAAMAPVYRQRASGQRRIEPEPEFKGPRRSISEIFEAANQRKSSATRRLIEGTPFGRRVERLAVENEGKRVIATGVSLEQFTRGAKSHQWGTGARYVPILETVFAE